MGGLRQDALDRLKKGNAALLQCLSTLSSSSSSNPDPNFPTNTATPETTAAAPAAKTDREEQLVPRASWLAICEQKAQLEDDLCQKEERLLRLRQVFAAKVGQVLQGTLGHPQHQDRVLQ
jgi:hypothetical protein